LKSFNYLEMSLRNRKRKASKRNGDKEQIKFHASVDKQTTLSLYKREGGLYLIIQKSLSDYDLTVTPSEAPILNQYLRTPEPFESFLTDIKIIEKELDPLNISIKTVFGETKEISLLTVKLAIGSGENDYVTIDEGDLYHMDVEPTLSGLAEFVKSNEDSVIGICDRIFDHERGNIVFLETKIRDPDVGVSSIEMKVMSSLQQRNISMQKNMKYAGIQLYTIIKAEKITDQLLDFLREIGVNWEIIFLRRDLSIENWVEIECEKNSINLKGYLSSKFDYLGFFDVNNIVRVAVLNQLNFKIVHRMAELLDRVKAHREELTGGSPNSEPIKKAEIIAAARLSSAYYGIKVEIQIDKEIDIVDVQYFEAELIRM
jgi:hypothetical protein